MSAVKGGCLWQDAACITACGSPGVQVPEDLDVWRPGPLAPQFTPHSHPNLGQVHGPLLRLNQVSPADSGEYSCQVTSGSDTLRTSVQVTIQASSPAPIPGE